jgi:hypothetical protein
MATPTALTASGSPAELPVSAASADPCHAAGAPQRHLHRRGSGARQVGTTAAVLVAAMAAGAGFGAVLLLAAAPTPSSHPSFHCPRLLDGQGAGGTVAACTVLAPEASGPHTAADWRTDAHNGQ